MRALEQMASGEASFFKSLKDLSTNFNYFLLLATYGWVRLAVLDLIIVLAINVGVFYAVSTLLSQMVLAYHPDAQEETGTIGLLIVVAGEQATCLTFVQYRYFAGMLGKC